MPRAAGTRQRQADDVESPRPGSNANQEAALRRGTARPVRDQAGDELRDSGADPINSDRSSWRRSRDASAVAGVTSPRGYVRLAWAVINQSIGTPHRHARRRPHDRSSGTVQPPMNNRPFTRSEGHCWSSHLRCPSMASLRPARVPRRHSGDAPRRNRLTPNHTDGAAGLCRGSRWCYGAT
jgi:hypothetical protein